MLSNICRIRQNGRLCIARAITAPRVRCIQFNSSSRSAPLPENKTGSNPQTTEEPNRIPTETPEDTGVPLQFLSRPLGVTEVPSALPKSWEAKREELLDREKHIERRRHLWALLSLLNVLQIHSMHQQGYDYHGYIVQILISAKESAILPRCKRSFVGQPKHGTYYICLRGSDHPAIDSLYQNIRITCTIFCRTNSRRTQAQQKISIYADQPSREFTKIMARLVVVILAPQNMEYLRVPLGKLIPCLTERNFLTMRAVGMENKHIGYTYLVDENLKVRWAGCAFARPEESEALANCTRVLLDRLAGNKT
ncbi:ATP10 domain-containing protein [Rhizoctonia solani AG-1 IA]|uniref:ATP10 domain-containing protein n=1 Tax=Thanatephorus cucumeris (strain AG1-IA) TaxID=983506 RepID=L8WXG2_THACA|nr:ATP10 domain-containing protein [Rhizoctonia solani AG-1 IA]